MTFSPGVLRSAFDPFWIVRESEIRIRNLLDFLMYSSVFVALISVGMVYLSIYIQRLPLTACCFIIPFLEVFAIYNINNRTDGEEDVINRKGRYLFTEQYGRSLSALALFAIILAMILSMLQGIQSLVITCIPLVLGFLYSASWLPPQFRYHRLKEVPMVKNMIVGFSWGLLPGLLPVLINKAIPDGKTFITFLLFFTWGFVASIIPDIRDREGDVLSGIHTIPVIFGNRRARLFLLLVNMTVGIIIIRSSLAVFPLRLTGFFVASIMYSETCIYLMKRETMRDFVSDILSDGQFIFFACAIFSLTILHIIA
jgi:4-hydroxybenzoate polyprenyltransferase